MDKSIEAALEAVVQAAKVAGICGEQQLAEKKRAFLRMVSDAVGGEGRPAPVAPAVEARPVASSAPLELSGVCLELSQEFYFECAHSLERDVDAEPSRRIHGHTYHAEVSMSGVPSGAGGMVLDLAYLKAIVADVREKLDHRLLDSISGLGPGTIENLCKFIAREVHGALGDALVRVKVWRAASGDSCVLQVRGA